MIEEAGLVAVLRGVDHDVLVDGEQEGVMPFTVHLGIALVRLVGSEPFAGVFDHPRACGNPRRGEGADALKWRGVDLEGEDGVGAAGHV